MSIHKLVNIHPNAQISEDVEIGAFVTIEDDVVIGRGTTIDANAVIKSGTRIGENCKIFSGAVLGAVPQDLKFQGESSTLQIGNSVTIREYCTLNRGTKAGQTTIIGDQSLLMAYVHVAHDCKIGKNCILANNVTLAGHIIIEDYAILGGMVAVHQFVTIGTHTFVGGGSLVRKDIPPYIKAAREPLSYVGVNAVGLKRRGFSLKQIHQIQDIYRFLFVKNMNTSQAIDYVDGFIDESLEKEVILEFIRRADRGIIRGFRQMR